MIKLYVMSTANLWNTHSKKDTLSLLEPERRAYVLSMKNEKNQKLSAGVGLLLLYGLLELRDYGEARNVPNQGTIDAGAMLGRAFDAPAATILSALSELSEHDMRSLQEEARLARGKHGKPYLVNNRYFISFSHSGEYALCAISDEEIGVDMQEVRPIKEESLRNKICSTEELLRLSSEGLNRGEDIFRIWTAKEAYVKYTGEGLKKDFRELQVDFENGIIQNGDIKRNVFFPEGPQGYVLVVCFES